MPIVSLSFSKSWQTTIWSWQMQNSRYQPKAVILIFTQSSTNCESFVNFKWNTVNFGTCSGLICPRFGTQMMPFKSSFGSTYMVMTQWKDSCTHNLMYKLDRNLIWSFCLFILPTHFVPPVSSALISWFCKLWKEDLIEYARVKCWFL